VRGRNARILYERRFIASRHTEKVEEPDVIVARNGDRIPYHAVIPFEAWMPGAELVLDGIDEGCCSRERVNLGLIAENLIVTEDKFSVVEKVVVPGRALTTAEKLEKKFPFVVEAGSRDASSPSRKGLTIYFRQDKHVVDENYMNNRQSLIDLLSVVNEIESSGDSEVESIVIAGFASPEGGHLYNLRLSERRSERVLQIIMENSSLDRNRIEAYGNGEDWEGLRELVEASNMPDKARVLRIIDNVPIWDSYQVRGREGQIMLLNSGATYMYMMRNLFPQLREATFITVYYKNK
jgi:hypothetical protein